MKSRKKGDILIIAGIILILSAAVLFSYNMYAAHRAAMISEKSFSMIQGMLNGDKYLYDGHENRYDEDSCSMKAVMVDGFEYIGYLRIPALDLELPVMADWDYKRLRMAPCRQFGSAKSDNLVIAAHNYRRHFGRISKLRPGDIIEFADMEGYVYFYRTGSVDVISPDSVDEVKESGWDLVLYTCTYGGRSRIMAGAERLTAKEAEALKNNNIN